MTTLMLLSGCAHQVNEMTGPPVEVGSAYSVAVEKGDGAALKRWWESFDDPLLDKYMGEAFAGNFTLKQAYARIEQARAFQKKAGATLGLQVTGDLSRTLRWDKDGRQDNVDSLKMTLSWEADLFGRLSSAEKAAALEGGASVDDMAAAALLLSSRVAESYCRIIELRAQLALLSDQLKTNETFLDLIKLRFSYGEATLVDVHQQRQQLAAIKAQMPLVRSGLITESNRFHVLLGRAPLGEEIESAFALPGLPRLPETGIPADLLIKRPDLRRAHKRLVAADYRVAAAVADRLPKIRLGGSAGMQGTSFSGENRLYSLFGEIAGPIIDWGRRKAEVERQKAVVREELARYSEAYIVAIGEVENGLRQEKEQRLLISALAEQLEISEQTLAESQNRYMQGLSDYLPVLAALQIKQRLERDVILRERELISNRILLYRALGGTDFMESFSVALKEKGKE